MGLLIDSENQQALELIKNKFEDGVHGVYIDPPYNTKSSEIMYKNEYRDSSWLALIHDRLLLAKKMMLNSANICVTIDDYEFGELSLLLDLTFFRHNEMGIVPIRINPSGRPSETGFALTHEYAIFYRKTNDGKICRIPRTDQQLARFNEKDKDGIFEFRNLRREGSNSNRIDGQRQYYPIYANLEMGTIRIPEIEWVEERREWDIIESAKENETIVFPVTDEGVEKNWRWSEENVKKDYSQFKARIPRNGTPQVYYKYRPRTAGTTPLTMWTDAKYSATEHGTKVLKDLFGISPFTYPKSIHAVEDCLNLLAAAENNNAVFLDFFSGSGTTGHAVINLNRCDNGTRKFILVEMGLHFSTALLPRIKKVAYASSWKDGKPTGIGKEFPCILKYLRLESYEDTLNNLSLKRTDQQQSTLDLAGDNVKEEYLLSYMLDIETKGSDSLPNIEKFRDPWNYKLKITRNNETKETPVDLVETFNYLIGLHVNHIDFIRGIQVIDGKNRDDEKILVLWRNIDETDNDALNAWFEKQDYNTKDQEYDIVYINGDNNLENLRRADQTWKVRMIEPEFQRLMFDVEDV